MEGTMEGTMGGGANFNAITTNFNAITARQLDMRAAAAVRGEMAVGSRADASVRNLGRGDVIAPVLGAVEGGSNVGKSGGGGGFRDMNEAGGEDAFWLASSFNSDDFGTAGLEPASFDFDDLDAEETSPHTLPHGLHPHWRHGRPHRDNLPPPRPSFLRWLFGLGSISILVSCDRNGKKRSNSAMHSSGGKTRATGHCGGPRRRVLYS